MLAIVPESLYAGKKTDNPGLIRLCWGKTLASLDGEARERRFVD
jgi:hypothetical protein